MRFVRTDAPMATKEQKLATKLDKDQSKVWEAGKEVQRSLVNAAPAAGFDVPGTGATSIVTALENPAVQKKVAEYEKALAEIIRDRHDIVGMAFAINGEVNTAEIYAGTGLFRKLWPKLLKSCSLEAISKKKDGPFPKVAPEDIRTLLEEAAGGKLRTETLSGDMRMKVYDGEKSVLFDTQKGGKSLHQQYIRKD